MTLFYVLLLLTRILFITKAPRNFKFFKRYVVVGNPVERGTLSVSGVPRNFFFRGGFQQIQLKTEDRGNGDLGSLAP